MWHELKPDSHRVCLECARVGPAVRLIIPIKVLKLGQRLGQTTCNFTFHAQICGRDIAPVNLALLGDEDNASHTWRRIGLRGSVDKQLCRASGVLANVLRAVATHADRQPGRCQLCPVGWCYCWNSVSNQWWLWSRNQIVIITSSNHQ